MQGCPHHSGFCSRQKMSVVGYISFYVIAAPFCLLQAIFLQALGFVSKYSRFRMEL